LSLKTSFQVNPFLQYIGKRTNCAAATEIRERIEKFKSERLGDKKKGFVDTVTQEAPRSGEEAEAMDITEG
jgi:hypothetical protein